MHSESLSGTASSAEAIVTGPSNSDASGDNEDCSGGNNVNIEINFGFFLGPSVITLSLL